MCVTQGRLILIFSWVLSGYQFLPFWKKLRMRGVTLKYIITLQSHYTLSENQFQVGNFIYCDYELQNVDATNFWGWFS